MRHGIRNVCEHPGMVLCVLWVVVNVLAMAEREYHMLAATIPATVLVSYGCYEIDCWMAQQKRQKETKG